MIMLGQPSNEESIYLFLLLISLKLSSSQGTNADDGCDRRGPYTGSKFAASRESLRHSVIADGKSIVDRSDP